MHARPNSISYVAALCVGLHLGVISPAAAQGPNVARVFPDHYEQTIRGLVIHLPKAYARNVFGNDGFRIQAYADDMRSFKPPLALGDAQAELRETISVYVGGQRRFPGHDWVRRGIIIRANGERHSPAEKAERLDGADGPPVPQGLGYHRALPITHSAGGMREDMFVPKDSRLDLNGSPLPEAIFCVSTHASILQFQGPKQTPYLRCTWMLVWRDLEVFILLDRRHLTDWRGLRDRLLALLESFVVAGPAEAGPPPEPVVRNNPG